MSETTVVLALGSNLGDRAGNLRRTLALLADEGVTATGVSSVWETPPFPADQPPFLNAVAVARTALDPFALLAAAKRLEAALGRRPNRHWGPRPADIDILFHGDERVATEQLTVPHALLRERAFVLVPLAEVIPGPLPVFGDRALDLVREDDLAGMRRLGRL